MIIDELTIKKDTCIIMANATEYTVSYEIALRYKLAKGKDIDNNIFHELLNESDAVLCKEYLYKMIGKYTKTEKGYRDKLYQVGFHKNAVDNAVDNALSYGYINDDTFCENYISTYKNKKGSKRLQQELQLKGISRDIIDKHLQDFESPEDLISNMCKKFVRNRERNLDTKQKLYRHLLGKGFNYDEVNKAVNDWFKNVE